MIAAISRMGSAATLAQYLHGPGRNNEHRYGGRPGGAVIAGTAGPHGLTDGMTWAKDFHRAAAGGSDRVRRPIWHCSLRAAPTDRIMTEREWRQIAAEFTEAMGIEHLPWVAVRHGDDHIHLAVCRVADDGKVWTGSNDRRAAQQARAAIEKAHQLVEAPRLRSRARRGPDSQIRAGEHGKALRTGKTPQRVVLAEKVIAVSQVAAGRGREVFEAECARVGIKPTANVASGTGRMAGYTFADLAVPDPERLVFKASQLHKCLSWTQLAPILDQAPPGASNPVVVHRAAAGRLADYASTWRRRTVGDAIPGKNIPLTGMVDLPVGRFDSDTAQAISLATLVSPGSSRRAQPTPPGVVGAAAARYALKPQTAERQE